jgi:O-antigen/teichoic acid export membrane protein
MLRKLLGLLTDSVAYGAGSVLTKLVGFLLIPLYTRYLAPQDYGILAMLTVLTVAYEACSYLGMRSAVFRSYSLSKGWEEKAAVFRVGLVVVTLSALAFAALGLVAAAPLTRLLMGDGTATHLVQLTLVTGILSTVGGLPLQVLQADRRARTVAALNLGAFTLTTILIITLVVFQGQGARGVVIARLVTASLTVVVHLWITRALWTPAPLRKTLAREMLGYGLPFVPYRLQLVAAASIGELAVRHFLGLAEAGVYSIALRFALPLSFVVGSINQAWWAYKFKIFREEEDPAVFFRSTVSYYTAAIATLWVWLSLWGPELVRWLTPVEYHAAAAIVPAAALIPVFQGLYQMLGTGIELGKDARSIPLVGTAGLVTAVVGALFLVPSFGAPGAAVAAALGGVAITVVILPLAQRRFRIGYDWPLLVAIALTTGAAGFLGHTLEGVAPAGRWLGKGALSAVVPLLLVAYFLASRHERARVLMLLGKLRRAMKGEQEP